MSKESAGAFLLNKLTNRLANPPNGYVEDCASLNGVVEEVQSLGQTIKTCKINGQEGETKYTFYLSSEVPLNYVKSDSITESGNWSGIWNNCTVEKIEYQCKKCAEELLYTPTI